MSTVTERELEVARKELQDDILQSVLRFSALTGLTPLNIDLKTTEYLSGHRSVTMVSVTEFALYSPDTSDQGKVMQE